MKAIDSRLSKFVLLTALVSGLTLAAQVQVQGQAAQAEITKIKGNATYSAAGGAAMPLKVGDKIPGGSVIKTGPGAYADVFFGNSAGYVRVLENSTLNVDKFALSDTGADTAVDLQLNLPEGTAVGRVNKLSAASKYEVKLPYGIAGIRGTVWKMTANGTVVLLSGSLILVHAPAGQNPVAYPMNAPPPVYFQPGKGVLPAPDRLIEEVNGQTFGLPGAAPLGQQGIDPNDPNNVSFPPGPGPSASTPDIYVTPVRPSTGN
jgi:hypothetical protein